ncbi:MAG: ftsW [Glaciihabitans sp.]|jgi:cell division protein FtsW|nr:ftsW [Glaciihabitans sp.]MDQ1571210.1 cell division protein FtsW [Actinomycetota bacterium]
MTTTRPPRNPRKHDESEPEAPRQGNAAAIKVVQRAFGANNPNFYLLFGTTLFLVVFGLVMVLSSSSVEDGAAQGHDFFSSFARQGPYALIGVPLMLIASRMPARFWKRWAWPAVVVTVALQLLVFVPGLGYSHLGNQAWIHIGTFTAQPSELVKLALILWVSWIVAAKQNLLRDWKHVALPVAPVAGVAIGLVLVGKDLGTAIILVAIVLGCLFYGGVRLRIIGTAVVIISVVGLGFVTASSSRMVRINAWMGGCTSKDDFKNACWQTIHGWWGIASGGVFGSGLGESKVKWSWLPEADNDFIFAIIGEELGLIGAVLVLALFVVLAIAFVRIIRATPDPFERIVTSGVMIWVIGQAFVNIAVVLGFLPVLGVPLPLISAGGSSLIASLVGIGVVLSFSRRAPVRP